MGKEQQKEFLKQPENYFLPKVEEKTVKKVLAQMKKNAKFFIEKTFKKLKTNEYLGNFLYKEGNKVNFPTSFFLGASFVYESLDKEFKKRQKKIPFVCHETIEGFFYEISKAKEIFEQRQEDIFQKEIKKFLNKSKGGIFYINKEDVQEFEKSLEVFNQNQNKNLKELNKELNSILPFPNFYLQENPQLMTIIEKENFFLFLQDKFNFQVLNPIKKICQIRGAMYTYEFLRRQTESNFLEEQFKN